MTISREFSLFGFLWLFFLILDPGITYAVNVTLKSGNMDEIFSSTFSLAGKGAGNMWTISGDKTYIEACNEEGDFGFLTKQINITSAFTDVIYIAMETGLQKDNQSLQIYLYNGTTQLPTKFLGKKFFENFRFIYNAKNETASTRSRDGKRWTNIFKFHKNGSSSMTLGVKGIGVCGRVYSMKIYYYYCAEKSFKGVSFPNTVSPFEGWKNVEVNCSGSALPSQDARTLSGFCGYDGTWNISKDMGCFCNEGFEQNSSKQCSPCPDNHFKRTPYNETCKPCPKGSTNTGNRASCMCMTGHYHATPNPDPTTAPCFGLIKKQEIKVSVESLREGTVKVSWNALDSLVDEQIRHSLRYNVECFVCQDKQSRKCTKKCNNVTYDPSQYNLTQTSVEISKLNSTRYYVIRMYPSINTLIGKNDNWDYYKTKLFSPSKSASNAAQDDPKDRMTYLDYVVVSGIASGVLFMVMVVLLVVVVKRKTEYRNHLIIGNQQNQCTVEMPYIGQKLYVDPTNYDSPEDALNEFASELDHSALVLEKLIGGGEFGDVYKGQMKCDDGKFVTVAVKTLKSNHTEKNENDFLLEASVMGQFHDPNVVRLEGVITKTTPRMIVTEYMFNGSLDRFLRVNDDNLTDQQLISMARGVASGMTYLSTMNFIHRDLAARNILVSDDLLCKITDFGLSRSLETGGSDGVYATSGGKIPIRWTAPEAIAYRKFSTASDVWSFGVLLWEIMSFGDRPYWEWDNLEVLRKVEEGFRLPAPEDCPKSVHNLMLDCWRTSRSDRPKFEYITQVMNDWIRSPETMYEDPNLHSTIGIWLHSIKMGDYTSLFLAAGYENPHQLAGIGDNDLLKMGVKLIGHRNKILKAINAFNEIDVEEKDKLTRLGSIAI